MIDEIHERDRKLSSEVELSMINTESTGKLGLSCLCTILERLLIKRERERERERERKANDAGRYHCKLAHDGEIS